MNRLSEAVDNLYTGWAAWCLGLHALRFTYQADGLDTTKGKFNGNDQEGLRIGGRRYLSHTL